jgi:hypothetical protein
MANDAAMTVALSATGLNTVNGGDVASDHNVTAKNDVTAVRDIHATRDVIADRSFVGKFTGTVNASTVTAINITASNTMSAAAFTGGVMVPTELRLVWYDAAQSPPLLYEGSVALFFNAGQGSDGVLTGGGGITIAAMRGGQWMVVGH